MAQCIGNKYHKMKEGTSKMQEIEHLGVPQQLQKTRDCGVFVMWFFYQRVVEGIAPSKIPALKKKKGMTAYREWMASILYNYLEPTDILLSLIGSEE